MRECIMVVWNGYWIDVLNVLFYSLRCKLYGWKPYGKLYDHLLQIRSEMLNKLKGKFNISCFCHLKWNALSMSKRLHCPKTTPVWHIYTLMQLCLYPSIHAYIHTIHTYMCPISIHIYMLYTCIDSCIPVHINAYTYIYACMYKYIIMHV